MAAALSPEQIASIEQQLSSNPAILAAIKENAKRLTNSGRVGGHAGPQWQQTVNDVYKQFGIDFPDAGDYQIQVDPSGKVKLDRNNWLQRNADWVLPVATIATGGTFGALAPPAAALPGAAAPAVAGPAVTTAAVTAPVVATTVAATAPSLWSKIAAPLITTAVKAGTDLASTKIQTDAQKDAADKQIAADQEALAWQKDVFAQRQRQLSPYINAGTAANDQQAYLLGLTPSVSPFGGTPGSGTPSTGQPGAPPQPTAPLPGGGQLNPVATPPTGTESTSFTNLAPARQVKLRAPDGTTRMVDATQAPYYVQRGALVVS